jgi:hypothetical protein
MIAAKRYHKNVEFRETFNEAVFGAVLGRQQIQER